MTRNIIQCLGKISTDRLGQRLNSGRPVVLRLIALLAPVILLVGCGGAAKAELEPRLRLRAVDGEIQGCQIDVTIRALDDLSAHVSASVTDGVIFVGGNTATITQEGRRAAITPGKMRADDIRRVQFNCQADQETKFSGEYIIQLAVEDGNISEPEVTVPLKVFLGRERDQVSFFSSPNEFEDALLDSSVELNKTKFRVQFYLESGERPKSGVIMIQAVSSEDDFNPRISISTTDNAGVRFLETDAVSLTEGGFLVVAQPGPIEESGSRLVYFPFQMNPNSFEGLYSFDLIVRAGNDDTEERLPFGITLSRTAENNGDAWLSVVPID